MRTVRYASATTLRGSRCTVIARATLNEDGAELPGLGDRLDRRSVEARFLLLQKAKKLRGDLELLALGAPPTLGKELTISAEAKAAFDKGKEMRNCLVAHPQGGCLSDKGFTIIRKF